MKKYSSTVQARSVLVNIGLVSDKDMKEMKKQHFTQR